MANLERSYKNDMAEVSPSKPSDTYFPHRLHLDEKDVANLKLGDVSVGQFVTVMARAEVTSVSIRESSRSKKSHSVELTLKEAEVEKAKPKKSDADQAKTIYTSKE